MDTGEDLNPPYPIAESGVRFSASNNLVDQDRFGFQDPITQWVGGRVRTITFDSVLFAETTDDTIEDKAAQIERLTLKDPNLRRPPVCMFVWGDALAEMVLFETVEFTIGQLRDEPSGTMRRCDIAFTLKRYTPFSQTQIDPTKPTKESYFLVVKSSEASYEAIAKRFYGNPLYGDRLRKRHTDMPMCPTVGSKIHVPPKSVILSEVVEPEFHALKPDNTDAVKAYESILTSRNARKVVV